MVFTRAQAVPGKLSLATKQFTSGQDFSVWDFPGKFYSISKKILHLTIPSYTQEWFVYDDNAFGVKHGNEAATFSTKIAGTKSPLHSPTTF
jgi:hypothetical protein